MRAVGTMPRVGGEDAVDVGVDLADLGVERGGQRDGGGVGAAAAERGDVLGVLARRPGSRRRSRSCPASSASRIRPGVTSMILALPCAESVITPACEPVNDRAVVAEVGDRHRQQRHRDPLAGGQQHVELARRRQRARPAGRGRAARRWCRPSRTRRRRRRCRPAGRRRCAAATRLMRSASATDEPPYFCTTSAIGDLLQVVARSSLRMRPAHALSLPTRHRAGTPRRVPRRACSSATAAARLARRAHARRADDHAKRRRSTHAGAATPLRRWPGAGCGCATTRPTRASGHDREPRRRAQVARTPAARARRRRHDHGPRR